MTINDAVIRAAYASPMAREITLIDRGGGESTIKAIASQTGEVQLNAAELGVRGLAISYRVRKSDAPDRPDGANVVDQGRRRCVDAVNELTLEWVLYVRA